MLQERTRTQRIDGSMQQSVTLTGHHCAISKQDFLLTPTCLVEALSKTLTKICRMAFLKFCTSDPLLTFIRKTYDAVPMRLPDNRIKPLALFALEKKVVRYLGDLEKQSGWKSPKVEVSDLPSVSATSSQKLDWSTSLSLIAPFVREILDVANLDLEGTVEARNDKTRQVRLSLGRAKRHFVQPLELATAIEIAKLQLPSMLHNGIGREELPLLIVDSVLTAAEINLGAEAIGNSSVAAHIEAAVAGKVGTSAVIKSSSNLKITGKKRAPFAFTCLQLELSKAGIIKKVRLPDALPRAGATAAGGFDFIEHYQLGAENELVTIDENA